ncbi:hypothetical protein J4440_01415 [Candidatus Woesearchaeota archaeon]|nr:hypothetical protein [Candidatus Woesearchaeota archaeon]
MKRGILGIILVLTLASCSLNQPKTIEEYQKTIDYSCNQNSDCEKKDVGNCCGYYPQCTNKNFNPDKELVKELCKSSDQFSICGFEEIASCECINNKCGASK